MNERIKELAKEAGAIHIHGNPKDRALVGYQDIEKFAELIVRECAVTADKCIEDEWFDVGNAIKQHFGVEE